MAEKLFGLTAGQVQRVGRAVATIERQPVPQTRGKGETRNPTVRFWVELTAEDPANPGRYAWKLSDLVDHTWTGRSPEVASPVDEYSAIDPHKVGGMVGRIAQLEFHGYDAAGKPRYLILQAAATWLGMIAKQGPESAPDYTDERYWVKPVGIGVVGGAAQTKDDIWFRVRTNADDYSDAVTVINLREWGRALFPLLKTRDSSARPHGVRTRTLRQGMLVRVWTEVDDQDPSVRRYVMSEGAEQAVWIRVAARYSLSDADYDGVYQVEVAAPSQQAQAVDMTDTPFVTSDFRLNSAYGSAGIGINLPQFRNPSHYGHIVSVGQPTPEVVGSLWGWTTDSTRKPIVIFSWPAAKEITTTGNANADIALLIGSLRAANLIE